MLTAHKFSRDNSIISILLYEKVTLHGRDSDGQRILFDWLVVRSAEFLKCILAKRFANVFLLCRLGDISNEAGGHFERMYALWYLRYSSATGRATFL